MSQWYLRFTPAVVEVTLCRQWYNAAPKIAAIAACPCDESIIVNDASFATAVDANLPDVTLDTTNHHCYTSKGYQPVTELENTQGQQELEVATQDSGLQVTASLNFRALKKLYVDPENKYCSQIKSI